MKVRINTKTAREFTALIFNIDLRRRFQFKEVDVAGSRHSQIGNSKGC